MKSVKNSSKLQRMQDLIKLTPKLIQHFDEIMEILIEQNTVFEKTIHQEILGGFQSVFNEMLNHLEYWAELTQLIMFLSNTFKILQKTLIYFDYLRYIEKEFNDPSFKILKEYTSNKISEFDVASVEKQMKQSLDFLQHQSDLDLFAQVKSDPNYLEYIRGRELFYLKDICFNFCHAYESLVVILTFFLVLIRFLLKEPSNLIENALKTHKKIPVWQLYEENGQYPSADVLLKDGLNRIFATPPSALMNFLEEIFGPHGYREIRNRIVHNMEEEGFCEILKESKLKITFPDHISQVFSIDDLKRLYARLFSITVEVFVMNERGIFVGVFKKIQDILRKNKVD
ncbi:MAG: hypothetical protein JW776_16845 [Candidatus Lokiarchaeota archaeon]|nr:hypothetical protein [Candidatus Lokiarchaeota archaeon]